MFWNLVALLFPFGFQSLTTRLIKIFKKLYQQHSSSANETESNL